MAFQHYSDQDIPGGSISAWKHVIPALKSNFLLKLYYVCMYITYLVHLLGITYLCKYMNLPQSRL